jgi:hypothetical protein
MIHQRRSISVLLFLFVLAVPAVSVAQRFLGALSAGVNLSQVDGDEKYGFHKVGLNIGPSVIFPFGTKKQWSVTLELLYSQEGAWQKSTYPANDVPIDSNYMGYYDGYRLYLNYVQVPLMIHYTDKRMVAGGVGVSYGQLVGVSEYEDHNDQRGFFKTETSLSGPYARSDWQILADVRVRIWMRLWLNLRYSYSMKLIRTREFINPSDPSDIWTRKQYNNVIGLRLVYIFNDLLPNKKAKKSDDNE